MFEQELKYFKDHQSELATMYRDKVLVIRGAKVEGAFEDASEAYTAAVARFSPGTFMIQPCIRGPEAYTVDVNLAFGRRAT